MIPTTPIKHPQLTDASVAAATAELLNGPAVHEIRPIAGSVGNQNFLINTDAGLILLKAGDRDNLAPEAWACEHVRSRGVPAPEVAAVDLDGTTLGVAVLLLRCLPGQPAPPGHPAVVEAGRQLRRLHAIEARGFGHLETSADGAAPAGPYQSWQAFTDTSVDCLEQLVEHDLVEIGLGDRVRDSLHRHRAAIGYDGPPVLLHGDLHPRHIFAADGRLAGIIDWGDVAAGDPLFDLARFSRGGEDALPGLLAGYGLEMTDDLDQRFTVYRMIWSTWALYYEWKLGGDWFDSYRQSMAEAVDRLRLRVRPAAAGCVRPGVR